MTTQLIDINTDITGAWKNAATYKIDFTNNGNYFKGWTIEIDVPFEITKIWNAEIVAREGTKYVIQDVPWNDDVQRGETTSFGFKAKGAVSEPSNFVFNGQKIDVEVETEIEEPIPVSPPKPTTLSNKAITVGFKQHNDGTKYDKSAQSKDWNVDWVNKKQMDDYAFISDSEAFSGENSLKITYRPDARTGGSAAWKLPAEKEYYLSYRVKFEDDFDFDGDKHSGGKLPGLAGAGGYCSGGQTCNGNNGFSSRYMWVKNGQARLYLYHMDKPGKWGDNFDFKDSNGQNVHFERGKWHNLTQRVRINDGHKSNGEIDVWMDGEQVLEIDNLKLVTNNKGIDALMFSTFFGGGESTAWWPDEQVNSYFDDFVVSTEASDVGLSD